MKRVLLRGGGDRGQVAAPSVRRGGQLRGAVIAGVLLLGTFVSHAGTIYVTPTGGAVTQDGSSWATAYAGLAAALANDASGDDIWLAAGTYKPTTGTTRTARFDVDNGVAIYGGFDGTETALDQRDPDANPTILSGDIGVEGDSSDNSYGIMVLRYGSSTTVIDGLILEKAYSDSTAPTSFPALHLFGTSPANICNVLVEDCVIRDCSGDKCLGGVYARFCAGTLRNVTIQNCETPGPYGGAISVLDSTIVAEGCLFAECTGIAAGAAYVNAVDTGSGTFVNCTAYACNTSGYAFRQGGAATVALTNSIVWGNTSSNPLYGNISTTYSCVKATTTPAGTGNTTADPKFADESGGDFTLQATSPCIDAGNNSALSAGFTRDLAGNDRKVDIDSVADSGSGTPPIVDMGAYETQPGQTPSADHVYHVNAATGDDSNDGLSWGNALATLQKALDLAVSGDDIWVAAGTYKPTVENGGTGDRYRSFQLENGVDIYGGFAATGSPAWNERDWTANLTILSGDIGAEGDDSDNCYHVVYAPDLGSGSRIDNTAVLDGFTITKGNAAGASPHSYGGGAYCMYASPTFRYCRFTDNQADSGAGLFAWYRDDATGACVVASCVFDTNVASDSGGGICTGQPVMSGSTASTLEVSSSVFYGNTATRGGGLYKAYGGASLTVSGCTFVGNEADYGGGLNVNNHEPVYIRNTIMWANLGLPGTGSGAEFMKGGGGTPAVLANCCIKGGVDGPRCSGTVSDGGGNTADDPRFRCRFLPAGLDGGYGTADDGLRPTAGSPCIDSGNDTYTIGNADVTGDTRTQGAAVDMGAYEGGATQVEILFEAGQNGSINGTTQQSVPLGGSTAAVDATGDPGYTFRYWDGDYSATEDPLTLTNLDRGGKVFARFGRIGGILYVDVDATGANDGTSWTDAFNDPQDALDIAVAGDQIWVAEGTYLPSASWEDGDARALSFTMVEGVELYGGFDATESALSERDWNAHPTILSGDLGTPDDPSDNAYHVICNRMQPDGTMLTSAAVLDGFTVAYGAATGTLDKGSGGGMYSDGAGATIRHCTFMENSAGVGGALYTRYSGVFPISETTFRDNTATSSTAAVRLGFGSPTSLTSCAIYSNSSSSSQGGVMSDSQLDVTNCVFSDNSSPFAQTALSIWNTTEVCTVTNCTFTGNLNGDDCVYFDASGPRTMTNCIVRDNTAGIDGSTLTVAYCNVEGGHTGTGNTDEVVTFANASDPAGADGIFGTEDDGLALLSGSASLDDGTAVGAPADDITGSARPRGGGVDRGAYELFVNSAPVASNDSVTVDEDASAADTLSATDSDGDPMTFEIVSQPGLGIVTITDAGAGAYTYTPDPDVSGTDSFTFRASDPYTDSNTATITVTITPDQHEPLNSSFPKVQVQGIGGGDHEFQAAAGDWTDWEGNTDAFTYAYQWQRTADSQATVIDDIAGAIGLTYTPTVGDSGYWIRLKVVATDTSEPGNPTTTAYSNWVHVGRRGFQITLDNDAGSTLIAGVDLDATDAFDLAVDETTGAPDDGTGYAYFTQVTGSEAATDIVSNYLPYAETVVWGLHVIPRTAGTTTLSWDAIAIAAELAPGSGIYLQPVANEMPAGDPLDMTVSTEIEVSEETDFQVCFGRLEEVTCSLSAGWNLIGIPILTCEQSGSTFRNGEPGDLTTGPLWRYAQGAYVPVGDSEAVRPEFGLWCLSPAGGDTRSMAGVRADGVLFLSTAWALVTPAGVCTLPTDQGQFYTIWLWNASLQAYEFVSQNASLLPGRAYWIRSYFPLPDDGRVILR